MTQTAVRRSARFRGPSAHSRSDNSGQKTPACAVSSRDVNWYDGIMRIAPISTAEARPIRDLVLRPGFPPGGSIYTGDDASDTLHLGAFTAGPLVAVATICREPLPEADSERVWRLRGMGDSGPVSRSWFGPGACCSVHKPCQITWRRTYLV